MQADLKFIITSRFGITALSRNPDNFWVDSKGTLYAFREGKVADAVDRCGVWPLALPLWPMFQKINEACVPHEFAFTSPVYQAFHTFDEANNYLKNLLSLQGHPFLGEVFSDVAKLCGIPYWEGK